MSARVRSRCELRGICLSGGLLSATENVTVEGGLPLSEGPAMRRVVGMVLGTNSRLQGLRESTATEVKGTEARCSWLPSTTYKSLRIRRLGVRIPPSARLRALAPPSAQHLRSRKPNTEEASGCGIESLQVTRWMTWGFALSGVVLANASAKTAPPLIYPDRGSKWASGRGSCSGGVEPFVERTARYG
jgi:hypothetical protein